MSFTQEGDVISRAGQVDNDSPQDELARFQLLKAKLEAQDAQAGSKVKKILGNMTELEQVALDCYETLSNFNESSPEFAQIFNLTGTKNRFKQAQYLAERVYEQTRSDLIMSLYTPDKLKMRTAFIENTKKSLVARAGKLSAQETKAGVKSAAAVAFNAALKQTGLGGGGAGSSSGGSGSTPPDRE